MASIISSYGGQPISAPSMREVPLDSNPDAIAFADGLERGEFDLVILLTGVGTRALVAEVERVKGSRDGFVRALGRMKILARGPKPVAVLRELALAPWLTAPEPNTWREVLSTLDGSQQEFQLSNKRVAVQEYGASNPDLLAALEARGARVTRVPVYQWALPEDLAPLEAAVRAIAGGQIDVGAFHDGHSGGSPAESRRFPGNGRCRSPRPHDVRRRIDRPDDIRGDARAGDRADLEPTHPKMGFLVREAAERAGEILKRKRVGPSVGPIARPERPFLPASAAGTTRPRASR